jgi:ethanolaminephosphotransferase
MPRIKAIISGTLPSFMDYILNLSAYKFNGENIVENAFKANKKTVFYGDDTWIQVLPQQVFHRSNGTSSFFATDYIEVDTNVTYNIHKELKQLHDWDIMIAHYLGVDHIGHSHGGHNSHLMPQKLLEMDNVIKNIYETVSKNGGSEPYLIVITGDHGMTDVGNHGGNTLEETETALIFLSTHKTKTNSFDERRAERILQIDIASTLSSMMGLPLPNKSRGRIILSVLDAFYMEKDHQMCHLFSNAVQIDSLITSELSSKHKKVIQQAFKVHISIIEENSPKTKTNLNYKLIIDSYNSYINLIQTELLTEATKRSIFSLLTLSVILAILPIFGLLFVELNNSHSVIFTKVKDIQTVFAYISLILNCIFLLSTSYIEAEHHYWYLMTSTFTLIHMSIAIRNYSQNQISLNDPFSALRENNLLKVLACFLVLIILRVSNYWNQLYDYDIGEWFVRPENKRLLSALVICSLIAISYLMSTKRFGKQQCLLISGLVWVYLYRYLINDSLFIFRVF